MDISNRNRLSCLVQKKIQKYHDTVPLKRALALCIATYPLDFAGHFLLKRKTVFQIRRYHFKVEKHDEKKKIVSLRYLNANSSTDKKIP